MFPSGYMHKKASKVQYLRKSRAVPGELIPLLMKMASGVSASGISVSMLYLYNVCENEDDFPKRLICLTKGKKENKASADMNASLPG